MSKAYSIVQIGDIIQTKNDKSKQLQTSDYLSNGMLPIVDQGADLVCGYTNDLSKMYDKGLPVIVFGDHTLHTKYVDFDFAIGADGTQLVGPKNNDCDIKYLYYLISRAAKLIGSEGYKRHFRVLKEFETEYINSFPEQQKIATILSSVDNVIEKTRAQIDKLKDLKTGMMQELLTKGIGHTDFKDSPVGRIPISWKAMPLGTVCELEVGYAFKSEWFSDSGVRLLRGDNVGYGIPTWERIQYLAEEQAKSYSRYLLDVDDVVIGMDRTFTQSGAKITKIRSSDVPALLVQRVGKFVPEKYTMKFLWQLVRSSAFIEGLKAQEKGMDIPHLSKNEILSCVVVLPPFKEQEEIADILEAQDILIECEREKLAALEEMKRALMQDLLLGEVRVG